MSQLTFAEAEYEHKKRKTRREVFLEKLDQLLPCLLYTSPSPRDLSTSRMPSSA